jgi:hypothetical protein
MFFNPSTLFVQQRESQLHKNTLQALNYRWIKTGSPTLMLNLTTRRLEEGMSLSNFQIFKKKKKNKKLSA